MCEILRKKEMQMIKLFLLSTANLKKEQSLNKNRNIKFKLNIFSIYLTNYEINIFHDSLSI